MLVFGLKFGDERSKVGELCGRQFGERSIEGAIHTDEFQITDKGVASFTLLFHCEFY